MQTRGETPAAVHNCALFRQLLQHTASPGCAQQIYQVHTCASNYLPSLKVALTDPDCPSICFSYSDGPSFL